MSFPRIPPYKTFAVARNGARTAIDTYEIVLERPAGIDLEIHLAPHPNFLGAITVSTFRGRLLLLEPSAADVLYVFVENWPIDDRPRKSNRGGYRNLLGHVYSVDARGEKSAIAARSFAIQTGAGLELLVDLTPPAPWAHHVCIESSGGRSGSSSVQPTWSTSQLLENPFADQRSPPQNVPRRNRREPSERSPSDGPHHL